MAVKPSKATSVAHTAGIYADMTLDGPEIGTLVAVVDRAKNLPNRRTMGKQDPYCAMRLGKEAKKTDTDRRGGQTPKWDQELRFTVHESPDYYKLKISVFNDDKKTDLIGEAFVNLADLIKPGGGSNDLWHQLNYKGKYAGEIRIEMTYYDLRPREEKPVEKKRQRGQTTVSSSDAPSIVSGPRQLGPREVKRRPLPASPGTTPTITPPATAVSSTEPSRLPSKVPLSQPDVEPDAQWNQQHLLTNSDYTDPTYQESAYVESQPIYSQQYYNQPTNSQEWTTSDDSYQQSQDEPFRTSTQSSRSLPIQPQPRSAYEDFPDQWDQSGRRYSEQLSYNEPSSHTYESPPHLPHASHSAPEIPQLRTFQNNGSPTKMLQYRDSPLRHSISQHDVPYEMYDEPESIDTPPPPPPKHRDSGIPRPQPAYPPSSFTPQMSKPVPRRPSIDERSPLQSLEYGLNSTASSPAVQPPSRHATYDTFSHQNNDATRTPERQYPHDIYSRNSSLESQHRQTNSAFDRQASASARSSLTPNRQQIMQIPQSEPEMQSQYYQPDDRADYDRRSSQYDFAPQQHTQDPHSRRTSAVFDSQQSNHFRLVEPMDQQGHSSSYHTPDQRDSTIIRPTPQKIITSQPAGQMFPRKAVSPSPYPEMPGNSMRGTPFGPDSYDVLNPASSPVTNERTRYETPEQARVSARIRDAEKGRNHDPIIGDDGRVIDPADHLPSDTWAPEPEKKQRKPEHVIHVRTRNDPRTPGSSPNGVRMMPKAAINNSPHSSPNSLPSSGGRSTLQRMNPNRSLPAQPNGTTPHQDRASPAQQPPKRNSYHAVSPGVERPPLTEYQVPVSNSYSPRGQNYQLPYNYNQTPSKQAYAEDYFPGLHSDSLAAEMSMIDIGPSRGSRTALRSNRGY